MNNRLSKAIEIINFAAANNISINSASVKFGYSRTYVKNVKADTIEKFENGKLDEKELDEFKKAYDNYLNSRSIRSVSANDVDEKEDEIFNQYDEKTTLNSNNEVMNIEWKAGNNYPADHIKTLDELLVACEVDTDIWAVKDYVVNKWDVTSWKNNLPETIQNFQVKARLEKNHEFVRMKSAFEVFEDMCRSYSPPTTAFSQATLIARENNLLEISIFDLHLGKLAWAGETGENYDTKIARERFLYSIETLLYRAENFNYDKIVFPIGSDFFNSDTILNTTTHGTPQDEDLRWQKTFDVGCKLLVDGIELLKRKGVPVDVLVIPGNHDFERSYYLGAFLSAWYRDDLQVNVNNGASPRKYYRYEKVLIGFTHGSEEKEDSLPLLMATELESKKHWSDTLFHEWHLGHIHRKRTQKYTVLDKNRVLTEDLGVTVRYLSSLTGTEEWHHKKGYVGQIKAADAFIWNGELGLIAQLNSNYIVK